MFSQKDHPGQTIGPALAGPFGHPIVNLMLVLVTDAMNTPGVVIVGATNHVERIDPALIPAGRLDRVIRIELPDADAIAAILARYIGAGVGWRNLSPLAQRLVGQTGADIENLVRTAKASARRAGRVFSLSDIEAQVPDPFDRLSPRVRRRIEVYRNAQRVVAQVLGLAEMAPNAGDFARQLANTFAEERFHTEQTCDDVLAVIDVATAQARHTDRVRPNINSRTLRKPEGTWGSGQRG